MLGKHYFHFNKKTFKLIRSVVNKYIYIFLRWGGCVIALTSKDKLHNFLTDIKNKLKVEFNLNDDYDMDSLVFPTQPGMGASIYLN